MSRKVLVAGGAGFIGSHVVDAYVQQGYEVAVADDLSTGRRQNLNPRARFYQAGEVRHIYLDITKARRILGWQPTAGLAEGLARTVAYFRSIAQRR